MGENNGTGNDSLYSYVTEENLPIGKTEIVRKSDTLDFLNVGIIGQSPRNPLDGFAIMWYHVFLWSLFSSIAVHGVAAGIAFIRLRKHKIGRFVPLLILIVGFLTPITVGAITSAAIAGVYRASGFSMSPPLFALVWGVGQTMVLIFVSFTRILATL